MIKPIQLWPVTGKSKPGPTELQKMYFIDKIPPEKRPHLHTQDVVLSIGGMGSSKCTRKGTKILMYSGELKNVEDIKVGELVMGPDSKARTVTAIGSGIETFYKLTPTKGDPLYFNESHILSLKYSGHDNYKPEIRVNKSGSIYVKPPRYGGQEVINVPIKEYITWAKRKKSHFLLYRANCINFPNPQPLEIPPYILGVWLGDGSSAEFSLTNVDNEVIKAWFEYGNSLNKEIQTYVAPNRSIPLYRIENHNQILRDLNLQKNKHIPFKYKTSTEENRLELLAGFVDTDGSTSKSDSHKNSISITQKSKVLAEDLAFLCRSLGFAAYIKEHESYCMYKGEKRIGTYYRVNISGDLSRIPTKIPRKQFPSRLQKKNVLHTSFKLEKLPPEEYFGFTLLEDPLYVLGDFTVTHNTYGAVARLIDQATIWERIPIYVGAFNLKVLKRNVFKPFNNILNPSGSKRDRHPFLITGLNEHTQEAKFANGSTVTLVNLKDNIKENIGFTAGLIVIDELHLLKDEESLFLIIGRLRAPVPHIRQIILCTNPERLKGGWINQTFELHKLKDLDTSDGPKQVLMGPRCECQMCTNCQMSGKPTSEWVFDGEDYVCPNCEVKKDFYYWKDKKYWCPGGQQYWRVIKSESHHNKHNPGDYGQGMKAMYDEKFYNIMVKGELDADLREDYVYSAFSEDNILYDPIPIDWSKDIYWSLDFNLKPQCSIICQIEDLNGEKLVAKEEIVMYGPTIEQPYDGANVVDVALEFCKRYKSSYAGSKIYIYGDPHGYQGKSARELTRYAQIVNVLTAHGFQVEVMVNHEVPPLRERIDDTNHVLRTGVLLINPPQPHDPYNYVPLQTQHIVKSLSELKWKEPKTPTAELKWVLDASGDFNAQRSRNRNIIYCMTHPGDAISYLSQQLFSTLRDFTPGAFMAVVGKTIVEETNNKVKVTNIVNPHMPKSNTEVNEIKDKQAALTDQIKEDVERINNLSGRGLLSHWGFNLNW